jgi:hypothetical protein
MKELLTEDFGRLQRLLSEPAPEAGSEAAEADETPGAGPAAVPTAESTPAAEPATDQLDLFGR